MDDRAYENCPNCVESVLARRREGYHVRLAELVLQFVGGRAGLKIVTGTRYRFGILPPSTGSEAVDPINGS